MSKSMLYIHLNTDYIQGDFQFNISSPVSRKKKFQTDNFSNWNFLNRQTLENLSTFSAEGFI